MVPVYVLPIVTLSPVDTGIQPLALALEILFARTGRATRCQGALLHIPPGVTLSLADTEI